MRALLPVCALLLAACDDGALAPATAKLDSSRNLFDGNVVFQRGALFLIHDASLTVAPEVHWFGNRGGWVTGMDVHNNGGSRDLVLAAKKDWPQPNKVADLVYVAHNGDLAPTVGIGVTPPRSGHRLEISGQDTEPGMGTLLLRGSTKQTANLVTVVDSAGTPRWWLDAAHWLGGSSRATGAAVSIKAEASSGRPLAMGKADGSNVYGFEFAADESGTLLLRYLTGGFTSLALLTNGKVDFPNGLSAAALRVDAAGVPASSSEPCDRGEITFDDEFVYVCVATDTWKRSALSSW